MDKNELDNKITDAAKVILSYCTARTSNQFDAEDLAQDIILEIYKSADKLRNEKAFYGFMWAVSNNVYKNWCKKKVKTRECSLTDDLSYYEEYPDFEKSELYLLRRELTLLNEKYRKAVILYYINNKSCSEISAELSVSESMVKYLLFKSRQILKEGINLERNYGTQSYNPKELSLLFWGNGGDRYYHLADSKISQNILFACYNDKLTAEQISLEIGVSLPYMEENLNELLENELLKKDGNRYCTDIVIFTIDFMNEVSIKTAKLKEKIADIIINAVTEKEKEIRNIDFKGSDMGNQAFCWQMACIIFYRAIFEILHDKTDIEYPEDKYGTECFVWGSEKDFNKESRPQFSFGVSNVVNKAGDYVQFMDFPINGEMVHHYCFNRQNVVNVFIDIAKGNTANFSENDKAIAADMVRKGYVISSEGMLTVNVPVFTAEQHKILNGIFENTAKEISNEAELLMGTVAKILKNHIPVHLKSKAYAMAYFRLFEDAISAPVSILCDRKYLLPYNGDGILPTTYVILNK